MTLPSYLQVWIVDKETGMPIEEVSVAVTGGAWPTRKKAGAGGDVGIWQLLLIPYSIRFTKSGYRTVAEKHTAFLPYEFMKVEMKKI